MRRLSSRARSQSAPSGAPGQPVPNLGEESYEEYCQRRIAERLPVAAGVVFGSVLFYALGALISRPEDFAHRLLPYGLELAIPAAAWWLGRRPLRRRAEYVALAADMLFTGVLVGQMLLPAGATSLLSSEPCRTPVPRYAPSRCYAG